MIAGCQEFALVHEIVHVLLDNSLRSSSSGTNKKEFSDYLLNINKELAFVQFELRGCRNQYDGEVYYSVVNNVADEQSKLGTKYTVPQIAFYKGIIQFTLILRLK